VGPTTDTEAHDAGGCTPKARASNATARAAADGQTAAQAPAAGPDRPARPFRPALAFLKANLARRSLLRWPVGAGRAGDRGHFGVAVLAQWLIVVGLASALLTCIGGGRVGRCPVDCPDPASCRASAQPSGLDEDPAQTQSRCPGPAGHGHCRLVHAVRFHRTVHLVDPLGELVPVQGHQSRVRRGDQPRIAGP
jgi:hypothetical protein